MQSAKITELRDRDWEVLLRSIERDNCVLLLGPELDLALDGGQPRNLASELAAELAEVLSEERDRDVPRNASLSLVAQIFENELSRDVLEMEVERFYRKCADDVVGKTEASFEGLATIPFSMVITSRHDTTFAQILAQNGKEPRTRTYEFTGDRRDILGHLGTAEEPLVYQLHGSLDKVGSVVITENDQLEFLRAVVSENPKLPTDLTNQLRDKNFLFVGFGIRSFQLRLLLHVLDIDRSTKSFALERPVLDEAPVPGIEDALLFFRATGYKTLKILDADLDEFVQALRQKWEARAPTGGVPGSATQQAEGAAVAEDAPSVFISYVSEDQASAQRITDLLRAEGLDPWLDKEGLRVGTKWNEELSDTISRDADFFVVLQSEALSDRLETYVHKEVRLALDRQEMRAGRFIFPVIIDEGANRLDAVNRARIQSMPLYDIDKDGPLLAKEIRREHARQQRR